MIAIKNYELLFEDGDNASEEWLDAVFDAKRKNNKRKVKKLFKNVNQVYLDNYQIRGFIENFTSDISSEELVSEINNLKDLNSISFFDIEDNVIEMIFEDQEINVAKLTDVFPGFRNDPNIKNDGRTGKCHESAVGMAAALDEECDVVTGYIYGLADVDRYLHSIVEINEFGEDYIIDYTLNAVFNKEGYNYLTKFEEIERIHNDELKSDLAILTKLEKIPIKAYLTFRHEIMKDIGNNIERGMRR